MRSATRSRASRATFSGLSRRQNAGDRKRRANGARTDERVQQGEGDCRRQDHRDQRSLLLRLDTPRARRDRGLLRHPLGARTVEPATGPAENLANTTGLNLPWSRLVENEKPDVAAGLRNRLI